MSKVQVHGVDQVDNSKSEKHNNTNLFDILAHFRIRLQATSSQKPDVL